MADAATDAAPAIRHGPPLERDATAPRTLLACLAGKIARHPDGRLVEYDLSGAHRVERFATLWARSASLAAALRHAGAEPRRPVVLLIESICDFLPMAWACIRAGRTFTVLNGAAKAALAENRPDALCALLEQIGPAVVVLDEDFLRLSDWLARVPDCAIIPFANLDHPFDDWADQPRADPVCLVPTSGSTGRMKLAALGEEALLYRNFSRWEPTPRQAASVLSTFPVDGVTGLGVVFLHHRDWVHLPPEAFTQNPLALLDALARFQIERVILTNSTAALVVAQAPMSGREWDLRSLRHVHVGGEPTAPRVMRSLSEILCSHGAPQGIALIGYGMTETGPLVAGGDPSTADDDIICLGGPAPGVSLRIVGADGGLLEEGEAGEVQAFCPQKIFSGYWNDPLATLAGFTADGWWRTGDLGRLRQGGLTLHGRLKELFVAFGKKFALADIDLALQSALGAGIRAFSCAVALPAENVERLAVVFCAPDRFYDVARIADEIRRTLARGYGLDARFVIPARMDQIPLTSAGKVRRLELAARVCAGYFGADGEASSSPRAPVDALWTDILGEDAARDPEASFFDLGGDSLKSALLFELVSQRLGRAVDIQGFFATPTLSNLRRLASATCSPAQTPPDAEEAALRWPLPASLRQGLLGYFETWQGERPTRDRLIAGLNTSGTKPPLFWCFQDGGEFCSLAERLGPDQPLFAMRSGHRLIDYREDEIQTLALRYVHEIIEACPRGPLFVGGNCQGAVIALAVAQHLLRRRRHVPLLTLMEWGFALQPYAGELLMLHGCESRQANPWLRFRNPEKGWAGAFMRYEVAEIPGAHGQFFRPGNVEPLAETLRRRLAAALARPAPLFPALSEEIVLSAELPARLTPGERRMVSVVIENKSDLTVAGSSAGVLLGNYWLGANGRPWEWVDGRTPLSDLSPRARLVATLPIAAPAKTGDFQLVVDLVSEGSHWLNFTPASALSRKVTVSG